MKEWGQLAYPRQAVHLPVNALNDWGRSGRSMGQGVREFGHGLAELAPVLSKVTRTGQQADAVSMVREIATETIEELHELPVRDWDYSWKQAYEPRVQEMLSQLSGAEREQARKLSEELGPLYSLDGQRKMEVNRIGEARRHWQSEVDRAVQRGDEETACRWIEQGREVFVPESEMPGRLDKARNLSLQASWQEQLRQDPYAALAAWQDETARKPADEEIRKALGNSVEKARTGVFGALALQLGTAVEQGDEPDKTLLNRALSAGILTREQVETAAKPVATLSVADTCNWLRRIDERDTGDDDRLTVEIALAPIPPEQRRLLLQRLQTTGSLPPQQRFDMSRALWGMYRAGVFGCPGDAEALLSLGRLQEEAIMRMSTEPEKSIAGWLENLRRNAGNWVCFDEQEK